MEFMREYLLETSRLQLLMADQADAILAAADAVVECFSAGSKLLLCGNGGSAADCQHVATELVSRLTREFKRPGLPAIALTTDTSFLTAFANDESFEGVFERQVRALGKRGDTLIAISTSGTSANVLRAVESARELGMVTIGLTGKGGRIGALVDHSVVVPSQNTQHIQEALLPIEHILCHLIERGVFPEVA